MDRSHRVDISGLLAGSRQHMVVTDEVPIESFEGVAFPEPVRVQLDVHKADRLLVVEGAVDARAHGPCDACLEERRPWRFTSTSTNGSTRRTGATSIRSARATS